MRSTRASAFHQGLCSRLVVGYLSQTTALTSTTNTSTIPKGRYGVDIDVVDVRRHIRELAQNVCAVVEVIREAIRMSNSSTSLERVCEPVKIVLAVQKMVPGSRVVRGAASILRSIRNQLFAIRLRPVNGRLSVVGAKVFLLECARALRWQPKIRKLIEGAAGCYGFLDAISAAGRSRACDVEVIVVDERGVGCEDHNHPSLIEQHGSKADDQCRGKT